MTSRLAGYELRLPDGWTVVPSGLADPDAWAHEQASRLVAGQEPPERPAGAMLADDLAAVVRAVGDAGVAGLETAVLVRRPELGRVDALLTVVAQRDLPPEVFAADLEELVRESDDDHLFAQAVEGTVPAGEVRGAHLMIGHLDPDVGDGVAHLEERVALGVFPDGTPDMLEVTAIASSVGSFTDMPQEIIDALAGLTVELEGTA